jgi:tetratricopeptide (TPR) repeat protein
MANGLIQIDSRRLGVRILTIVTVLLLLVWSSFLVRWYVGNTIAEYLNADENSLEMARRAVSLSPNDPLTHWRLGQVMQRKLPASQLDQAIDEYEKAVQLSPNDYRFWMSLGTAREQHGDVDKAEYALRQSVALAPSYSYPAWFLGNLLLRSGRTDAAFAELRRASEADTELRPQLFNLAWEVYGSDFSSLQREIGSSAEVRAQFSQYLFDRGRSEDALRLWNSLSENEKRANRKTGRAIIASLLSAKQFHNAMAIWNDLSLSVTYHADVGKILDGGFETDLTRGAEEAFGWQVKTAPQPTIALDANKKHSGGRSLRMTFQVRTRLNEIGLSQLIAVAPATEYDLEFYLKTEGLQSGAAPVIQVLNAADNGVLVASSDAPNGNNDWQPVALHFKTGDKMEAIIIRVARDSCGEDSPCPIFGTVWYDDFSLTRKN